MKKFILIIFLIYSQLALAQSNLKSLIQQTLASHPKLKEQQQAIKISEYRNKLSQSQYLPTINGEASYSYINPVPQAIIASPLGENRIQFQPPNNYSTAITVNQLLFDFGKTSASLHKNRLETETATQGLASGQNALAYQVAGLYYSVVYLQKSIEVQQAQIKLLTDNEAFISDKIKDGDEIEYNLVATQVRRQNAEIRLADLENQKEKQLIFLTNLSSKTDIQVNQSTDFQTDIPNINASEGMNNNFDLKIAKLREETALQDIKTAQRGRLPSLYLQGSVGYRNGIQPTINDFTFNYLVGARLNVPIFAGFRNQNQVKIGQANYQLSKYATENQTLTIKTNLSQAENDYKTAQEKLARSEAQVKQAEYALELADTRYQNGIITNLDVLTAQTALQEAQLNKLQYEYQTLVAKLEWHRWAGTKFWE
jgi:outer membrane protein TolC